MKSFYTILYATINPTIQEQISIGLLLVGRGNVYFDYSEEKLKHIRKFLPNSAFQLLKDSLKNITNTIEQTKTSKNIGPLDMKVESLHERVFTQEYIDYLSRYNKNLLSFSRPKQIDIEPSKEYQKMLFEKFIFKNLKEEKPEKLKLTNKIKIDLYPKIEERVNIDKELSSADIDTLLMPVNVNFIGKNGDAVVGKALDFQIRNYDLEAHLGHLAALIKALDDKKEFGKYFVIGDEPEKKYEKQHNLWKDIYNLDYMDLVPSNETDKIAEYIEEKNVQPFI